MYTTNRYGYKIGKTEEQLSKTGKYVVVCVNFTSSFTDNVLYHEP